MKYWFKNVADNIYIYPKSAPRNLILQTRTSDCNSAKYIELTQEEFKTKMTEYTEKLTELFAEGNVLQKEILEQLKKVKFETK